MTPSSRTASISGAPAAAGDVAYAARSGRAHTGHGIIWLLCPVATTRLCGGTFTLETTGRHRIRVANDRFRIGPGLAARVSITVSTALFRQLRRARHLDVTAATVAHDGARRPHHRSRRVRMTLVYVAG